MGDEIKAALISGICALAMGIVIGARTEIIHGYHLHSCVEQGVSR